MIKRAFKLFHPKKSEFYQLEIHSNEDDFTALTVTFTWHITPQQDFPQFEGAAGHPNKKGSFRVIICATASPVNCSSDTNLFYLAMPSGKSMGDLVPGGTGTIVNGTGMLKKGKIGSISFTGWKWEFLGQLP